MAEINQLSAVSTLSSGDLLPAFITNNGDTRKAAMSVLLSYMQDNLTFPTGGMAKPTTQYAAPSATGFSVQITNGSSDIHLILTPTAGYAAGTIILPIVTGVIDKQIVIVNCTQQVTALTINGNGAVAVTGEPTTLAADDFFTLKYDAILQTWFRVA